MKTVAIVIADDHAVVRDGLRAIIERNPSWRVVGEASNGWAAVRLVQRLRPRIVVMDVSMPELNGLEATRRIRRAVPETEVLVLTMHDSDRLAHQALAAGASGFILKSDARSQLAAALQALTQGQPYFTPRVAAFVLKGYLGASQTGAQPALPEERLSAREREVLQLVAEGKTTKEVASVLKLSEKTVEAHRTSLCKKLHLHSVAEMVRYAIRNQIIEP